MTALDVLIVAGLGVLGGIVALVAVSLLPLPGRRADRPAPDEWLEMVFQGGHLVRTCPTGRQVLGLSPMAGDDLARVTALLTPRFPDLASRVAALAEDAATNLTSDGPPPARLGLRRTGDGLHMALGACNGAPLLPLVAALMAEAAGRVHSVADNAPFPLWRNGPDGALDWANRAYLAAAGNGDADEPTSWPPPGPFPEPAGPRPPEAQRVVHHPLRDGPPNWYEIRRFRLADGGHAGFALPVDALVRAETSLRGFMQTLSRTFAHLPVGLAIFDGDRRLSLFNPVLGDLTGLPPEFLARRPTLHAVLDRLRELRMIPEPRDYAEWRRRLADIERAAEAGHYTELWPLPSGRTFRLTGQPDSQGGIALMLEDVTSETARNRGLKARGDLLEAALGAMGRVIAVFGTNGAPAVQTPAYARLWGLDAGQDMPFDAALDHWQSRCRPSPVWAAVRAMSADPTSRNALSDRVILADGRILSLRVGSLAGLGIVVEFRVETAGPAPLAPRRKAACRQDDTE